MPLIDLCSIKFCSAINKIYFCSTKTMADLPLSHALTLGGAKIALLCDADGALLTSNLSAANTPFGDAIGAPRRNESSLTFCYPSTLLNTALLTKTLTNPGGEDTSSTASILSSRKLRVSSGVAGNGTSSVQTFAEVVGKKHSRYVPGIGLSLRFSALFSAPQIGTDAVIGMTNGEDSIGIGYVNGVFSIFTENFATGVVVVNQTIQPSFNQDILDSFAESELLFNPQMGNIFQIDLQWLGFGSLKIFIENPVTGKLVKVHVVEYANANTIPLLANPNGLRPYLRARHFDFAASPVAEVYVESSSMGLSGFSGPAGILNTNSASNTVAGTTASPVIGLRCSLTMPVGTAFTNMNTIEVLEMDLLLDGGNKGGLVTVILNPTTRTNESWSAFNVEESLGEIDTSATVVTGGTLIKTLLVEKDSTNSYTFLPSREPVLQPGDIIYFVYTALGTAGDITVAFDWRDLF